ncbi:polysaccharide lyase [Flavobacteriaceae bacterium D16]|nr:polysaccharide lyase [Flavobacteriaceae bacterium D16]
MKFYPQNSLVSLCLICSILFFTSCSKDSDLLLDTVLLDPETAALENTGSASNPGSDGQIGSAPTNPSFRPDSDFKINSTFDTAGDWDLRDFGTVANGVLTVVGGGNSETSPRIDGLLNPQYYPTRRFRVTFDARQTAGSGDLVYAHHYTRLASIPITSSWDTYTLDYNGNEGDYDNYVFFKSDFGSDVFEIDNFTLEIIGDTTDPNVPGRPAQITFYSDFEDSTYGYDQYGPLNQQPVEINQWEIDFATPRTTDHPDSAINAGRDGTGTAAWLGVYNNSSTRNEIFRDVAVSLGESWVGFSFYVQDTLNTDRIWMQYRTLAPLGSGTVNPITIRQSAESGKLKFQTSTDPNYVDQTKASLGYWNGAGTNTETTLADYNYRGWNDVVIHFKGGFGAGYNGPEVGPNGETLSMLPELFGYDPATDGILEIWLNGVKIVDHVGTTLYRYNNRGGQIRMGITPKIGPYWGGPTSFAVGGNGYYDNYSIWSGPNGTYEDVDPNR